MERVAEQRIIRRGRDSTAVLSFAQQRLWFMDQCEPNSSVYNMTSALRIRGRVNIGALERSLKEIIERHEILRTVFPVMGGVPIQAIRPSEESALEVMDVRGATREARKEQGQRLCEEETRRPFDLAKGPLFRSVMIRLGEDDQILSMTMHHIVSDGWSMRILHRELSVLYRAFSRGEPSPLSPSPIQYSDYAVWQREWLTGANLERQLEYWKKQLAESPAVLNLAMARRRPAVLSFRGQRQNYELSAELTEKLKEFSLKQGATLYMTLLAAFQTLLCRCTGQEDIVVGSPIANRNRAEIEELIGFFVNTLVLRCSLAGNPSFETLLRKVRGNALDAYEHQDLPFEKLVEEMRPDRSLNHTPLFQVLFNMVNQEEDEVALPDLKVERIDAAIPESKFEMTLYTRHEENRITLDLVYRVDLFDNAQMRCFLEQYGYLLEQIVAEPCKPILQYSLVTAGARAVLPDPAEILTEPPQDLVVDAFMSWAKRFPAAPAMSQGSQTWTYAELARCADILARVMVATGMARGEVVAVHGQPSFGLVTAVMAVFLSGGVLLLIDSALPKQRKRLMLREAKARKVIGADVKKSEDGWLEDEFGSDMLFVEPQEGCALNSEAITPGPISLPEVTIDDPAYIFFTSGTTGTPKAILGCHKGLSHFLAWQRQTFAVGPGDRSAQIAALSFDAVLRDIFLPLTSGAELCLRDAGTLSASTEMIEWLVRNRITIIHAVPSLAKSWIASVDPTRHLKNLRWVFFIGEPLTEAFVHQWRTAFPNDAEIVNLYGPTETTLVKCFYTVPADMSPGIQPIGRPIPDTQALILNGDHQLCGINEPGEIVLRTPFRTLGYINAAEENCKRFVQNPFRDDPTDLIYFTGDAGCYQPDGILRILGRLDDEIKIRGVRIEPAEVTATLAQHPDVESCVVVGAKNGRHETTLAAYVVPVLQKNLTRGDLAAYLLERLPAAMVPSTYVFLDSLPLAPNGKIDRRSLPEPDPNEFVPDRSDIAPRTELENTVARIWAAVLKVEKLGVHDNFFDLGGHSLLATQIIARIREVLRADVTLRALFEKPTIAGLSEHLKAIERIEKALPRPSHEVDQTEEKITI